LSFQPCNLEKCRGSGCWSDGTTIATFRPKITQKMRGSSASLCDGMTESVYKERGIARNLLQQSKLEQRTMSDARNPRTGLEALLTPERSVLLLIDHQAFQFSNLHSHEPTLIINNVVGLAKAAKAFKVPTILTTVTEERGGYLLGALQDVFPTQKPINRTFINTWEDQRVVEAVKKTARRQLIIAALWTEVCLAMPVIQSLGDGYNVFFVTDASGGVSREAHDMAVLRMVQAGAVPITWIAVMSEWQRDWAREATVPAIAEVTVAHGGASGVAFAWEQQLLNSGRK
jgi:nicotinamidase-related amidase